MRSTVRPRGGGGIERGSGGRPPGLSYPFRTDDFGRDILSRLIHGARISLLTGLGAVAIRTALATLTGVLSGYRGDHVDTILQSGVDALMAFPAFIALLTIMAMLGQGVENVILALGTGGAAGNARAARSAVLAVKNRQYIEAARAVGYREEMPCATSSIPSGVGG